MTPPMPRKSSKKAKSQGVTLNIVLEHMHHMQGVMEQRFDRVEEEVVQVRQDVGGLKSDMREVKQDLAVIKVGIENIDQRLEDVETVRLPKLEAKVFQ